MTTFLLFSPTTNEEKEISLGAFLDISIGATIKSAADWEGAFEFGTTDRQNYRIRAIENNLFITVISTVKKGEYAPIRVNIGGEDGEVLTAYNLERKLFALRQIYAINYLIKNEKLESLYENIEARQFDFEAMLLPQSAQLVVGGAAPGSLWLTLIPKTKEMLDSIVESLSLLYPAGRDALLRRVNASTEKKELEVEKMRMENKLGAAVGVVTLAQKIDDIKDLKIKEALQKELLKNIYVINPQAVNVVASPARPAQMSGRDTDRLKSQKNKLLD